MAVKTAAKKPQQQGRRPAPASADKLGSGDIAVIFGKDEAGVRILRRRSAEAPLEAGVLRPLVEGKPIDGEVVSLRRRPGVPLVFDVKTELASATAAPDDDQAAHDSHDGDPRRPTDDGPAQVSTPAYRRGWDAIWGPRRRSLPN